MHLNSLHVDIFKNGGADWRVLRSILVARGLGAVTFSDGVDSCTVFLEQGSLLLMSRELATGLCKTSNGVIQHCHQGAYESGEDAGGARVVSHTWICEVFLNKIHAFRPVPEKATLVEIQPRDWLDDPCFFLDPECFPPSPWTPWGKESAASILQRLNAADKKRFIVYMAALSFLRYGKDGKKGRQGPPLHSKRMAKLILSSYSDEQKDKLAQDYYTARISRQLAPTERKRNAFPHHAAKEKKRRGKEREREIKTPGFPAYPLSLQRSFLD